MVSITLSTFIDFLLARNASRLRKVRDAKHLLLSATEEYRQVEARTGMDALLRSEASAFLPLWEDDLDVA